ncbi:Uncharacterized protein HZ326_27266 [Fusarium oxysporum f. sp. albedinis]|nr:Uncharacterized protein HZ326_27266 [Fusarium oxysporum f. sp. albedinis]
MQASSARQNPLEIAPENAGGERDPTVPVHVEDSWHLCIRGRGNRHRAKYLLGKLLSDLKIVQPSALAMWHLLASYLRRCLAHAAPRASASRNTSTDTGATWRCLVQRPI